MSGEGTSGSGQVSVAARGRSSKYDVFKFYNTLTGVVRGLVNHYTIVDLRNESYVSGKIQSVDGNMNIEMSDVVFYDPKGKKHVFENFFVSCRNIRYVHIPKKLNSIQLLERQFTAMSSKPKKKTEHTFKKVRAERKQKETLLSVYDQRQKKKDQDL